MTKFDHQHIEPEILELVKKPVGLVLIGGVAFSGITTTANNLMRELKNEGWAKKIVDVSNRYDYNDADAENVISIEVARDPYKRLMYSALASDPDVIFLGEIRDKAKANWAVKSTECGHKTLAEVHAFSVSSTLVRYCELTGQEHLTNLARLGSVVIVSQFLLSRDDGTKVAVREFLALDKELLQAISASDDLAKTAYVLSQTHGQSFYTSALKLHAQGLITDDELERIKAMQVKHAEQVGI